MDRRELLTMGIAAASSGAARRAGVLPLSASTRAATADPIVVEGLSAGYMRLSHLRGMQQGGVDCCVAGGPSDMAGFASLLHFFDAHRAEVVLAKSVAEIRRAKQDGKVSNVFCWQSADALGASFNSALGSPRTALRAFAEIGLRIVGLCYNVANQFGAGCLEPTVPLTRAGERLVEEIHRLNLVLDVGGHTGERTSLDAIAISRGVPVVCTHTNIRSLNDNARCTSDRVIDAIAATGGVIGLTAVSDFHVRARGNAGAVPQATLDQHLDQFDYLKNRVGVDHVGLGPDFVDGMAIPYGGGINKEVMPPDMLGEPWLYVRGFESIAELPNVARGLRARGWSEDEVNKALGGNWLRVYEKVWG
jgi:membrane dipeptidase